MTSVLQEAKRPVVAVSPDDSVSDAVRLMTERDVGCVVVIDEDRPVGLFSEHDLVTRVVYRDRSPRETTVRDVMTTPVLSASRDADISQLLGTMERRRIRHLPVVDGTGHVVGVLTRRHLARETIETLQHDVDALVAYSGFDGHGG